MADDWDTDVTAAPTSGGGGGVWNNDSKGGVRPPGGRGRGGVTAIANQISNMNIGSKANDEWGAGIETPVGDPNGWNVNANSSQIGWETPAKESTNGWGAPSKNGADDEPRGGGWGSSAGGNGGGGGWKGAGGGGGGSRACHKCGEEGHMSRDCPKGGGGGGGRGCFKCGEDGHMSRDCPKGGSGGGGGGGSRACHKCGEEGHMSRECPSGGGGGGAGGGRGCFKCGEEGHMSRDCPTGGGGGSRACHKCGEEGHMSRECPSGGGGGGGGGRGCFKCGEEGHMSRECPTGGGGGGGGSRACHKCGEEGHMSRECPTGGGGDGKCFKCHETGHMSKDCPNPFSNVTEDGKPREAYIPPDVPTSEEELFQGIKSGSNFANFDKVALQVTGSDVPQYFSTFEEAGLRELLLKNIKSSGYVKPTPVQKGAMPVVLAGRDLIASAVTGSGKTAAYLIPVLNMLLSQGVAGASHAMIQKPEVVIIAPTRELAIQIHQESRKFSHNSVMKTVIVYGGTVVGHQRSSIQSGCNILVATPGRLKDFIEKQVLDFTNVKFLILDEADRMLDMGFGPEIEKIACHPTMPPVGKRQTLMFSATFPGDVQQLAGNYLYNYIFVTTGNVGGTNPDVRQEFHEVARNEKRSKLMEVLADIGDAKVIVFVDSKKTADFVAAFLCNNNIKATSIHGDRLQSQRELALREFKTNVRNVLVATNVAARGLDIAGVDYVVNYDLPADIEEYVHRIGRTGRVGNLGKSISFYDADKDGPNAGKLVEKLNQCSQDVPSFLQSAVSGVGGMGFNFDAPSSNSNFASRDVRRFGAKIPAQTETEESWD